MTRLILVATAVLAIATSSFADVTIKSTTTGKGLGMSGTMSGTTYIKGNRMRTDTVNGTVFCAGRCRDTMVIGRAPLTVHPGGAVATGRTVVPDGD